MSYWYINRFVSSIYIKMDIWIMGEWLNQGYVTSHIIGFVTFKIYIIILIISKLTKLKS